MAMEKAKLPYTGSDMAIIIPTKDRPRKIINLLKSLKNQSLSCGKIIIVSSGEDIRSVVGGFTETLSVEYYHTETGGQIYQRNLAIAKLDAHTELVACLDDDILLEPDALEKMLACWQQVVPETAGIGFNMINAPGHRRNIFMELLGLSSKYPGWVLRSGTTTALGQLKQTMRTQWLCGGATVWRKKFIDVYVHKPIQSRWAVYEDVLFSYPIGLHHPLYICAEARVFHDHQVLLSDIPARSSYLMEKNRALWKLYFVSANNLSFTAYCWHTSATAICGLFAGLISVNRTLCARSVGRLVGLWCGLNAMARKKSLTEILERVGQQLA
jgi:glycosyltransferase involved in cell wall biosynthesis